MAFPAYNSKKYLAVKTKTQLDEVTFFTVLPSHLYHFFQTFSKCIFIGNFVLFAQQGQIYSEFEL